MTNRLRPGVLLALIVVAAAVLRFVGVDYGLPHPLVSDEEILIGSALRMAQTFNPFPTLDPDLASQLYYPVGLPWLYLVFFAPTVAVLFVVSGFPPPADLPLLLAGHLGVLFLVARLVSVAMAVATIWVIYRLALRLFDSPVAGLVAAALMATGWFHVVLGSVARHWSATVFLIWLAVLLAAGYRDNPTVRRACACALAAVAGFAVSYIAVLGYAGFAVAHLLRFRARLVNRMLVASLLVLFLGVAFFAAVHVPAIMRLVGPRPVLPLDEVKSATGLLDAAWFYLRSVWYAEPVLLVAGCAGALAAAVRSPGRVALLLTSVLGYVVFLYLFMPLEDRYILPALPALALLAGAGTAIIVTGTRVKAVRIAVVLLMAAGLAWSGWNAAAMARLMHAQDTRLLAVSRVPAELGDGAGLVVALNPVKLPASLEGLQDQAALDAGSLDFADRLHLERGKADGRKVVHLNRFPLESMDLAQASALVAQLSDMGYRYFLLARRHDREDGPLWQAVSMRARVVFEIDNASGTGGVYPPDMRTTILVHEEPVSRYARLSRLGPKVVLWELTP